MTEQEKIRLIVEKYDTSLSQLTSNATHKEARLCPDSLQMNLNVNNVSQ